MAIEGKNSVAILLETLMDQLSAGFFSEADLLPICKKFT